MRLTSFILFLLLPLQTLAQTLEYEVIRTESSPGFFAVRIFPGKDLSPKHIEDVFITNFSNNSEKRRFKTLVKELENLGAKVLTPEESREYLFREEFRLIVLGGDSIEGFTQFQPAPNVDIMESFTEFTVNFLGPIYLQNINAQFGGNVSEVIPDNIPYLNDKSAYFIGKFDRPMRTRMAIEAEYGDEAFMANFPIDLENYQAHELSSSLPSLWESLQKKDTAQVKAISQKWLINAFPIVLFLLGGLLIFISSRGRQKSKKDTFDDKFWNTPIEETPLYKQWEKNLPFETNKD